MKTTTCFFFAAFILLSTGCKKDDVNGGGSVFSTTRNVGASAKELLSGGTYKSLSINIQYMPGFAPDVSSVNNLRNFLVGLLNKPAGINVTSTPIPASGKAVLTLAEIRAFEKQYRTSVTNGSALDVYVLYADAAYSAGNTLGVAYQNTSLCIFGPTVVNNSGGINQPSRTKMESTVLEHEFGHIAGLVNLGSPMITPHEDGANSGHCNNSQCLMYFQTNTTQVGGVLMTSPVPMLDNNCRTDLTGNGGL